MCCILRVGVASSGAVLKDFKGRGRLSDFEIERLIIELVILNNIVVIIVYNIEQIEP